MRIAHEWWWITPVFFNWNDLQTDIADCCPYKRSNKSKPTGIFAWWEWSLLSHFEAQFVQMQLNLMIQVITEWPWELYFIVMTGPSAIDLLYYD